MIRQLMPPPRQSAWWVDSKAIRGLRLISYRGGEMKKLLGVAAVALLIAGGAYAGSPYLAASNLKDAAISGDADQLEAKVDFPAVRESLKSQFSTAMMQKMNSDPDMKGNPFAGLGMMMIPAIVDKAVDVYVTPDGLSAMVRGSKPNNAKAAPTKENPDIDYTYEWVNPDRFRVKMMNTKTKEAGPILVFDQEGFVSWKLVKVDIETLLKD